MFDIGASELLMIVIVAIVVLGPKDMPLAMRTAGRWIGKARRVSSHFRTGIDAMIREAEMEEMEREWKERNARIMADQSLDHPAHHVSPDGVPAASAEARASAAIQPAEGRTQENDEPQLPLGGPPPPP